ncbi:MAG: thioesterase family protein [Planctomycetota bacterium]
MKLVKKLRVRFGEIDEAGIVYYPRFFHYYHQLFEDFFYDYLQLAYHEVLNDKNYGLPCVEIQASFKKPLSYGTSCSISLEIEQIGRKSIIWKYEIVLDATQDIAAEARITTVGVQMKTFQSTEVPDFLRPKLEAFQKATGQIEI